MVDLSPTPYPDANAILPVVLTALRETLGEKLVGLSIFGSLVSGAYEPGISDVDLVVALTEDLDEADGARIERMHADIVATHPVWTDRIEVGYLSVATLRAFESGRRMGRISPGEPFHLTTTNAGWLFNLAHLRDRGLAIWGPDPDELVGPISAARLTAALRERMVDWRVWLDEAPAIDLGGQAYLVLTMCRARALAQAGANLGKLEAAAWAEQYLPEWAPLIERAIGWRRAIALGEQVTDDPELTLPEALTFARTSIEVVLGQPGIGKLPGSGEMHG